MSEHILKTATAVAQRRYSALYQAVKGANYEQTRAILELVLIEYAVSLGLDEEDDYPQDE